MMGQEMMGFWDAVASTGPYANSLHLVPDRTTPTSHQSSLNLLQSRRSFSRPANSV